jgi:hypothetical protein
MSVQNACTVHRALVCLVNDQVGAAYVLRDATLFSRLSAVFQDSSAKPNDYDTNIVPQLEAQFDKIDF